MQRWKFVISLSLLLPLLGNGCERYGTPPIQLPIEKNLDVRGTTNEWVAVDDGVERLAFRYSTSTVSALILYRFSGEAFTFRFEQSTSAKSIGTWADALPDASLIANGVYFHEDFSPSGALRIRGKDMGTRRFDLDKSGWLVLGPRPQLINTARDQAKPMDYLEAGQSYPFLVTAGKAAIKEDSGKAARRTLVGIDQQGRFYIGVLPDDALSLYALMNVLQTVGVDWEAVLNLDGGPSTGLWAKFREKQELWNSYAAVPNVLVVERKK
jgi:hypothetical protein